MRAPAATFLGFLLAATSGAQTVAITGATVHPVDGPALEGATVVITDGHIAAVGAGVAVPDGARVIDGTGKVVTPGLFDSATQLGLVEISAVDASMDARTVDDRVTAAFRVIDALDPVSAAIPVTRVEGITRAVVAPSSGASLIAGQGALIHLGEAGSDGALLVVRSPVAMFASLGAAGAELAGGSRASALLRLEEALVDARDFAANRQAYDAGERREYALSRLDLQALEPVVRGELPLAVDVNRASDILALLRLGERMDLRLILLGAAEAWMVADALATAEVPVIISPLTNIPGYESHGATLENAARLHAAGVEVAFGTFDTHNSRNLKQAAGNAVAYGMPWEAALAAITSVPARIWGVGEAYGAIVAGMDADLVVWGGDPFELLTPVEHVFVRGEEVPLTSRQRQLFERYRNLDAAYPPAWHQEEGALP